MSKLEVINNANYSFREKVNIIIFEADTYEGKLFDVILLWAILLSVITIMLESVEEIHMAYPTLLRVLEWIFTAIFTLEYGFRVYSAKNAKGYVKSFYGLIDLVSIIPTYLALFVAGAQYFMIIRALRLLRIFRILKLIRFLSEAENLSSALKASRAKIIVFIGAVVALASIVGTLLYLIEGPEHGFTSIPRSIYWAIVTLTTVGYGDIAPETVLGQFIATLLMILGYGIIAVPTGIVSAELTATKTKNDHLAPSEHALIQAEPNKNVEDRKCVSCKTDKSIVFTNYNRSNK